MTTLRIERLAAGTLDIALARLDPVTLVRSEGSVYLVIADEDRRQAQCLLARMGVRAVDVSASLNPPSDLVAARGRSLAPVSSVSYDSVVVRPLPLGTACVALLRRWPSPWHRTARRARCRALLADQDVAYLWGRQAWASPLALHEPRARGALRPMIFERAATVVPAASHLAYASQGALERWAFP